MKIKELLEKEYAIQSTATDAIANSFNLLLEEYKKQFNELKKDQNLPSDLEGKIEFVKGLKLPIQLIVSTRKELVEECIGKLDSAKNLWIYGNISTGKTQLAQLIEKEYEPNVYWFDLTDLQEKNFITELILNLCAALDISKRRVISDSIKDILLAMVPDNLLILNDLPDFLGREKEKIEFTGW